MVGEDFLDELHTVRERMLAKAGGTLRGLVAQIKQRQAEQKERVIPMPPKAKAKRKGKVA